MNIVLIAAVAQNRVIGSDGEMPWHYSDDLQHFRQQTMGSPVIMGRRTYESIRDMVGGPLDGRTNIVLSTTMDADSEGVSVARTLDSAIAIAEETGNNTVYIIGGATVYEQALPYADTLIITEVPDAPEGDTYFPDWDESDWSEVSRITEDPLSFVTYQRE